MANGRVITGFSKPYAALYTSGSEGSVTYSGCAPLARGTEVSLEPESSDDNVFYADNVAAESANGIFTGGTITLTVDGLFTNVRRKFFGLPEASADGWTAEGDSVAAPYVGIGYIVRYMSDGATIYVPTVIAKAKFSTFGEEAATQEDEIDWQTTELTASIMRDDTANHNWRFIGADFATEQQAEEALIAKLGGLTPAEYLVTFNTNGGSVIDPVTVTEGSKVERPADPTYEGHTFVNWYADADLISLFNFNNEIKANTTIYAKWQIDTFTVSFDTDGGSSVADQTVNYGSVATKPEDPTKSGYTFDRWYADAELTTAFLFTTPITEDTTIYAKWVEE